VGYATGARDETTCRALWDSIPVNYRRGRVYSDFWAAYAAVIPPRQHRAVGKETGQTSHIERFNNTLRQRVGRFVRKTLSFSKIRAMHDICLQLFVWEYNETIRKRWQAGRQGVKRFRRTRAKTRQ
jgi:insertion element IS1 protein InsB